MPKSVTFNDLEHLMVVIVRYFTEFGSFAGGQLRHVEDRPILSATNCSSKNLLFGNI